MKKIKRLYKSKDNRMLAGVCGGLAEYLEVDPTLIRLLFVLITVFSGILPGLIVYFLAAVITPAK